MKLSVVRAGGLAGMIARTEVTSESVPDEELRQKVAESGLADLLADPKPRQLNPDEYEYTLTVEDGGSSKTAQLPDSQVPDGVRSLIEWAEDKQSESP
ncbi:MAG: hypothetical protein QOF65_154 [Thermoleophilaceae bacterium]|jgi:hypothetical protein|nr:hypothetical protein [Thermoleophilaceae bacterium]MEA2435598.1 hypothetical protein [Thermoleophilaceae bacterium]